MWRILVTYCQIREDIVHVDLSSLFCHITETILSIIYQQVLYVDSTKMREICEGCHRYSLNRSFNILYQYLHWNRLKYNSVLSLASRYNGKHAIFNHYWPMLRWRCSRLAGTTPLSITLVSLGKKQQTFVWTWWHAKWYPAWQQHNFLVIIFILFINHGNKISPLLLSMVFWTA